MTSEIPIRRKNLWESRGNIRFKDWVRAAGKLGLPVTSPSSGSSHRAIRRVGTSIDATLGIESLVAVIYENMSKQVNGDVFKKVLQQGIAEDDIWKALGKL